MWCGGPPLLSSSRAPVMGDPCSLVGATPECSCQLMNFQEGSLGLPPFNCAFLIQFACAHFINDMMASVIITSWNIEQATSMMIALWGIILLVWSGLVLQFAHSVENSFSADNIIWLNCQLIVCIQQFFANFLWHFGRHNFFPSLFPLVFFGVELNDKVLGLPAARIDYNFCIWHSARLA